MGTPAPAPAFTTWTDGPRLVFCLPATLYDVDTAADRVRQALSDLGADQATCFKVLLLFREAILNAVVHGCGLDQAKTVTASILLAANSAEITVQDPGPGFDWRAALSGGCLPPDPLSPGGRGLCIMSSYAASMAYNDSGNTLTLHVHWP